MVGFWAAKREIYEEFLNNPTFFFAHLLLAMSG
jgi:hypothetical protein